MYKKSFTLLGLTLLFFLIFAGTACAADPVNTTNVTIKNTASNPTPTVGEQFFFNVTASNNGPIDAKGLQITDVVPPGLTYNGHNATSGTTYDRTTGIWNIGTLNNGSSVWLALNLTATAQVAGETVTNTATRTAEVTNDIAPATAKASVHIPGANVIVSTTTDNLTPNVGENFKYIVTAHNYGPDTAVGLEITDIILSGLTNNGYTASQGTYFQNNVWYISSLGKDGEVWLNLFVTPTSVLAGRNVTNTATKTKETTYDSSPKSDSVSIYVPLSHVVLTKTASNLRPNVGQQFTFTVTAHNYGPDSATNLEVYDYIKYGYTFNNYTASTGTYYDYASSTWYIGTLENGGEVHLYLVVTPTALISGSNMTNTATKISEDQYDEAASSSSVTVFVPLQANVVITTGTSESSPNVGNEFVLYVDAYNNGPDAAVGLQITDVIPAGFTYLSYFSNMGNYNSTTGIWYVGTLNNDTYAYLELYLTPNSQAAGKNMTNIATKTNENTYDPQPLSDSVNMYVPLSKVVLNKTASTSTPTVGQKFTYTIKATNNGPDSASNLKITDNLPSSLTYNGYTASPGTTYNYATGVWTIGTLINGATAWLNISVTPNVNASSKNVTNTAVRINQDQYNPESDTSITKVYVPVSQVALTKTTSNSRPHLGQQFTYRVTATNNGPDNATNVQVTDKIPSGLTFQSYTASPGTTYNGNTGIWTIGTLKNGAAVWLNLNVVVNPQLAGQSVTNTATKNHDQYDTTPKTVSVVVTVPAEPYVTITKTASNTRPNVGQQFTYTVTAKNYSPISATGLQVTDKIPSGFTMVGYQASTGTTYNTSTGVWNIGKLTNAASAWLNIKVKPTSSLAGKNVTNTATRTAEDQEDHSTQSASATVRVPKANVQLSLKANTTTPDIGKQFTYTITAKNSGPDSASNLKVTDKIPTGLTFNRYTASLGTSYNKSTGIWTMGTLVSGGSVYLNLYVTPDMTSTGKTITNTASKTSETEYDTAGKTTSLSVKVPKAAYVALTKKASDNQPSVGQQFTYTVTAKNNSPITATGVKVTDKIPSGLTLKSYSVSKGTTYNKKTGIWNIGKLVKGKSVTLKLNVAAASSLKGKNVTNTATRTSESTRDPAPKMASVTVQVSPTVSISQLLNAAYDVKIYYEHNKVLPPEVTIGGKTVVSNAQFLQLMVSATLNLNKGVTSSISIKKVSNPGTDTGSFRSGNLAKSSYLSMAQSIQTFINNKGRGPNYASSGRGNVSFSKLVYMYSKVLNFYRTDLRLPNSVYVS